MVIKYTVEDLELGEELTKEFEGHVEINTPSYPERMRLPKVLGIDEIISAEKADDEKSKVKSSIDQMEFLARAAEICKKYFHSVDLKHVPHGTEIKTIEELYDYPEASAIISNVVNKFVSGFLKKKK